MNHIPTPTKLQQWPQLNLRPQVPVRKEQLRQLDDRKSSSGPKASWVTKFTQEIRPWSGHSINPAPALKMETSKKKTTKNKPSSIHINYVSCAGRSVTSNVRCILTTIIPGHKKSSPLLSSPSVQRILKEEEGAKSTPASLPSSHPMGRLGFYRVGQNLVIGGV